MRGHRNLTAGSGKVVLARAATAAAVLQFWMVGALPCPSHFYAAAPAAVRGISLCFKIAKMRPFHIVCRNGWLRLCKPSLQLLDPLRSSKLDILFGKTMDGFVRDGVGAITRHRAGRSAIGRIAKNGTSAKRYLSRHGTVPDRERRTIPPICYHEGPTSIAPYSYGHKRQRQSSRIARDGRSY